MCACLYKFLLVVVVENEMACMCARVYNSSFHVWNYSASFPFVIVRSIARQHC